MMHNALALIEDTPSLTNDGRPKRWVVTQPLLQRSSVVGLLPKVPPRKPSEVTGLAASARHRIRCCGFGEAEGSPQRVVEGYWLRVLLRVEAHSSGCRSLSSSRAPRRMNSKPWFPSWQAYSNILALVLAIGARAVQGCAKNFGLVTVNS